MQGIGTRRRSPIWELRNCARTRLTQSAVTDDASGFGERHDGRGRRPLRLVTRVTDARRTKMLNRSEVDPIEHATALLSTLLHCRTQANALRACKRDGATCEAQEAAFVTCSQEHIGLVITHLVKIAEKKCPGEMLALQQCRLHRPGDDCEHEDMASIRCASLHVLAAAAAPKKGG